MRPFWISFIMHETVGFELHAPWWRSGFDSQDRAIICAAVMADSEDMARVVILDAHDATVLLEFRFVEEKPAAWSPFCDRFRRADWMKWPQEASA